MKECKHHYKLIDSALDGEGKIWACCHCFARIANSAGHALNCGCHRCRSSLPDDDEDQEKAMDDLMDHPCPVCGKRFGDHRAVPGWIGAGCPESQSQSEGVK